LRKKLAPFRFSTPLCIIRPYSAARPVAKLLSMKSAANKNTIDCFNRDYSASCSGSTRNLALPESDSPKSEFIADSEALLKISDKSVSNHAFKITTKIALPYPIILSIINQNESSC
jgi:hypothetical protein